MLKPNLHRPTTKIFCLASFIFKTMYCIFEASLKILVSFMLKYCFKSIFLEGPGYFSICIISLCTCWTYIYIYLASWTTWLPSPASQQTSDLSIINAWALFTHIFLFKVFQFFLVRQ
jgi:hypothetical protein